jgi:bla regulator protein blaR1
MIDLHVYLLKVSAGLAIISVPYYFLLRNDTNLNLKRIYLLLGVMISWIFPLIVFRRPEVLLNLTPTVFIDPGEESALPIIINSTASTTGITINWIKILVMVYLSGLSFMFLKNLFIIVRWNLVWKLNRNEEGVAFTRSDQVFTLFTKIFVPASFRNKEDLENILLHERAHVQQLHFIDLMVMELTLLLSWFNPFSWLISRMIKENHEYLADRQVLSAGINPASYRAQLLNHTLGVNVFRLGNQFNHSLTLKRFKMMKKPKNSTKGIIKMALLVPALLIAMGLTTGMTPIQQKTVKGKVVFAETGEPAPGTSVVIKNSTVGTVVDTEGAFMLNVEGDPEIVFSFVGYETLVLKASKIGGKPLELKQTVATYDLENIPMENTGSSKAGIKFRSDNPDNKPVFVLDGEVIEDIDELDPETIESVFVVKDPDSEEVKKYNAPYGVILITTKKEPSLNEGEPVFYIVEDMPTFNGGDPKIEFRKFIGTNLRYPESAAKNKISGRVIVQFAIDELGKVVDPVVVRSVDPALDIEALRLVKSSLGWTAGKQGGKTVKVMLTIPINFVINEKTDKEITGPTSTEEEVFYVVEDMPRFPGDNPALKTYIYSKLEYPAKLKKKGISGEVNVQFLVTSSGELRDIKAVHSTHKEFEAPAMEVFKGMPKWNPGKQRGKAVNVNVVVPVKFNIEKE